MTHYLCELYTPKPAWLALGPDARRQFFDRIGAGMAGLAGADIEAVALGPNDPAMTHGTAHGFFAIWRCPDAAALNALVAGIAATGWHDYFDTVNAGGKGGDLPAHLAQLAGA